MCFCVSANINNNSKMLLTPRHSTTFVAAAAAAAISPHPDISSFRYLPPGTAARYTLIVVDQLLCAFLMRLSVANSVAQQMNLALQR